jgi:hypothetical protein
MVLPDSSLDGVLKKSPFSALVGEYDAQAACLHVCHKNATTSRIFLAETVAETDTLAAQSKLRTRCTPRRGACPSP